MSDINIDTRQLRLSSLHLRGKIGAFDTKATLNGEDIGHLHNLLFVLDDLCEIADGVATLRSTLKLAKRVKEN